MLQNQIHEEFFMSVIEIFKNKRDSANLITFNVEAKFSTTKR